LPVGGPARILTPIEGERNVRAFTLLFVCASWLGGLGCQSERDPAEPKAPGDGRRTSMAPWVGGTTGDFGGDCSLCELPAFEALALDDDGPLGFTPGEVLEVVEGVHVGPVRWRDACAEEECHALDLGCPREPPSFAGTKTELRVEIERTGTPVLETCPARAGLQRDSGSYESCIGTYLHIPVRATLATADGLLEAAIDDLDLSVEPGGPSVGLGGRLLRGELEGSLPALLPELEVVEWTLWFDAQGAGADAYLLGEQTDTREENLAQLDTSTGGCQVGFPLSRAQ
jgi:hypothetical protein